MHPDLASRLRNDDNLLARLDRIPINRPILFLIFLLGFVWILEAFDIGIIAPVILFLRSEWHLAPSQVGAIGSSGTLGIVLGLLPAGAIADRYGRKTVLLVGIVIFSLFTFFSCFSTNVYELVAMRFIAGLGQGAVFPVPYLLLSEFVNKKWRGTAVGLSNSVLGFSYALNTLAGFWVLKSFAPAFGWRVLLAIGILPIVVVPIVWKWLPESPRFLLKIGRSDVVRNLVERWETVSNLPHDESLIDPGSLRVLELTVERRPSIATLLRPPYLQRCFVAFSALLSPFVVFYVITIYGPTILTRMGATKADALLYTSGLIAVGIITNIAVGPVGDIIGRKTTIFVVMTCAAISTILLGQDIPRTATIIVAICVWGFVYAGFPPTKLYQAEQFPTRLRATGSMLGEAVTRFLAGVVLTFFIPMMLASLGLPRLFVILSILTELCVVPIFFFGKQTSGISIEESGTDVGALAGSASSAPATPAAYRH